MTKHLNITVFGNVTGVNFRSSCKQQAEGLNISGFAQNEPAGSVYIEAEGEMADLQRLLDWCKQGNTWAKVERVDVIEGALKNFTDFKILWN